MTFTRRSVAAIGTVALLAIAGCASDGPNTSASAAPSEAAPTTDAPSADLPVIVASTSVYGSLAAEIVGDAAVVETIIDSPTQDPHSYEATARDQLTVDGADLIILNGGGYDAFMEQLAEAVPDVPVIVAVESSHDFPGADGHDHHEHDDHEHGDDEHSDHEHGDDEHDDHEHGDHEHDDHEHGDHEHGDHDHGDDEHGDHDGHNHIEGFNEHIWYDPHTVLHVVEHISEEAASLVPEAKDAIAANTKDLLAAISDLEEQQEDAEGKVSGKTAFFTEPVGEYLVEGAGIENVTTDGFAESVEAGQDVAPATLLAATQIIESGQVSVVVTNTQTGGSETDQIIDVAKQNNVPVVEFSETLPDGETYVSWMQKNLDAVLAAVGE